MFLLLFHENENEIARPRIEERMNLDYFAFPFFAPSLNPFSIVCSYGNVVSRVGGGRVATNNPSLTNDA